MRKIDKIIVHCSATPEGRVFTTEDIDRWHKARGFKCIGYHYVIYLDGSIHKGRDEEMIGAHCNGYNAHSIGVCYIGGLTKNGKTAMDTRTPKQKSALRSLLSSLRSRFTEARIHGHRDFANKACPSFDATHEYKDL